MTTFDASPPPVDRLRCMEVWGGNSPGEHELSRPGLDLWLSARASGPEGGGLHFVSSCASGRITRFLLADLVPGRGAFVDIAAKFRELLKKHVNRIQQGGCESGMRRVLEDSADQGGCGAVMMATYFAPNRRLTVCNAGHPPPLLYRAALREWSLFPASASADTKTTVDEPLLESGEYQRGSLQLGPDDRVLFYGESLLECRTSDGMPLSVAELLNRLRGLGPLDPQRQVAKLLADLEREHEDNLKQMDTTVILCKHAARRSTLRDNLLAPLRLMLPVGDKTRFSS
ncbi:SpoIIE family protein phosphatase [Posidoniimonas polymericola]|nr:SpoIIE family protein phosphatase [Posidoniimonas polymericola]